MFPIITHIDQVLPAVEGRPDFVVARKDGYTVIDYVYVGPDTFDDPIRLECRGIKFKPEGSVLARPLHKFFNVGEKPETQVDKIDLSRPHVIMDKLDGSMIHTAIVDGNVVFMTRMGRTDVALKAERHLTAPLRAACRGAHDSGNTLIFEWTAPDNRIVVPYERSELTLLAIRKNDTGEYASFDRVRQFANMFTGGPAVQSYYTWNNAIGLVAAARALVGQEGYVIRFDDGFMVKIKADEYVRKHRALDSVGREKNVIALILNNELDDVLPVLAPEDRNRIEEFRDDFWKGVYYTASDLAAHVARGAGLTQKEFATTHLLYARGHMKGICFKIREGANPLKAVTDVIAKHLGSSTTVESVRPLFYARLAANDNVVAVAA